MTRKLREPTTTLTDVALSVATAWFAYRLASRGFWPAGFASSSIAALLGAVAHGLPDYMTRRAHDVSWRLSLLFFGVAAALVAVAVAVAAWPARGRAIAALGAVAILLYAIAVDRVPAFRTAAAFGALALAVLGAGALGLADEVPRASAWLASAVAANVAGVVIQQFRIAPHQRFNHNDLYHVLQLAAFFSFYRAAVALG